MPLYTPAEDKDGERECDERTCVCRGWYPVPVTRIRTRFARFCNSTAHTCVSYLKTGAFRRKRAAYYSFENATVSCETVLFILNIATRNIHELSDILNVLFFSKITHVYKILWCKIVSQSILN